MILMMVANKTGRVEDIVHGVNRTMDDIRRIIRIIITF